MTTSMTIADLERRVARNMALAAENRDAYCRLLTASSRAHRALTPLERLGRDRALDVLDAEYLRLERSRLMLESWLAAERAAVARRTA